MKFPHFTLELTLTTAFLFVWFPLTSLTNIAVISLDQMHATIRPYSALRHRLIKKCVYGVTIAAFVWVLPAMFIILILKNRMFHQIPIFSTSSGPSVFSCGSLGHPTTGFCEITIAGVWVLAAMVSTVTSILEQYWKERQYSLYFWQSYCCLCLLVICVSYSSIVV